LAYSSLRFASAIFAFIRYCFSSSSFFLSNISYSRYYRSFSAYSYFRFSAYCLFKASRFSFLSWALFSINSNSFGLAGITLELGFCFFPSVGTSLDS